MNCQTCLADLSRKDADTLVFAMFIRHLHVVVEATVVRRNKETELHSATDAPIVLHRRPGDDNSGCRVVRGMTNRYGRQLHPVPTPPARGMMRLAITSYAHPSRTAAACCGLQKAC